jgi:alpha-glucosidase (family GH31 glycosyl hydrolase)
VPLWGTDIGGFYPVAPQSGELFARWFQFGTFNPVFRCHGQRWRMHVPWAYGPEIEAICRRYLDLRYKLMPYSYTLVREAHETGMPLMRMLALAYPDNPEALDRSSEFLWGEDILVAPVTREGARHWPVYLPRGAWYDFWTGVRYEGPGAVSVDAPIDRLPLFVRCGAILPLGPPCNIFPRMRPTRSRCSLIRKDQRIPHSTMTTARPMLIAPGRLRGQLSRSNNFPADWPFASLLLKGTLT